MLEHDASHFLLITPGIDFGPVLLAQCFKRWGRRFGQGIRWRYFSDVADDVVTAIRQPVALAPSI